MSFDPRLLFLVPPLISLTALLFWFGYCAWLTFFKSRECSKPPYEEAREALHKKIDAASRASLDRDYDIYNPHHKEKDE